MMINKNELLSALVDGELKGRELDETLQLIQSDSHARQTWHRYQMVSAVIRGHIDGYHDYDLTKRISAAIENESALTQNKSKVRIISFPKRFWKQAAGFAIAASLGALAVLGGIKQPENQLVPTPTQTTVASAESSSDNTSTGKRWTVGEKEVEQRLNSYLVEHNEYANAPDVFSYARVVSYDMGK